MKVCWVRNLTNPKLTTRPCHLLLSIKKTNKFKTNKGPAVKTKFEEKESKVTIKRAAAVWWFKIVEYDMLTD